MRKNLSKIIVFVLIGIIILSGFIFKIQAKGKPIEENSSESSGMIKAEIKSFRVEDSFSKNQDGFIISPVGLTPISEPVKTGIIWLKNNQNLQGSWNNNKRTEIIDTSAVISLLNYMEEENPSLEYQKAIDWFNLIFPENSDYLAEKVISLSEFNQDVNSLMEFLASQINEKDGGFGYQKDYQGEIITTAKVLKAITASNYNDPGSNPNYTLISTLFYFLQSQNQDGGFPKIKGGESDINTTTLVLDAFKPYKTYIIGPFQGEIVIQDRINLAINYLKSRQNQDGGWQFLESTAKVYDILLNYQEYPNYNKEALNYLLSNQDINGSFANQDIYLTAKALKAIAKPDIAAGDIKDISAPGSPITLEITIPNLGYNSIKIDAGKELQFRLIIDGQELNINFSGPIIIGPQAKLILEIEFSNLSFGSHTINFLIDYNDVELDKTNNQKAIELFLTIPGDTNQDCKVNVLDLVFVRNHLGQDPNNNPEAKKADVNRDGKINVLDLVFVRNYLGTDCK